MNSETIDKYQHSLQTAYLVSREFASSPARSEWIVAALFHDVFGGLNPSGHAEWIADVLDPYVSWEVERTLYFHDEMMETHWRPCIADGYAWKASKCHEGWFKDAVRFMKCDIDAFSNTLVYPGHHLAWAKEINEVLP